MKWNGNLEKMEYPIKQWEKCNLYLDIPFYLDCHSILNPLFFNVTGISYFPLERVLGTYCQSINFRNIIFRSGIAGTCPTCEVSNLDFLYLAYAFLFRYKSKNALCQQVLKSRFSNIFVDNSMILITKRN